MGVYYYSKRILSIYFYIFIVVSFLIIPFSTKNVFARPIKITRKNITQFTQATGVYVCRTTTSQGVQIGKTKKGIIKKKRTWTAVPFSRLNKKYTRLLKKLAKKNPDSRKGRKLQKKANKLLAKINEGTAALAICTGSDPGEENEFLGDPNSLAKYRENVTLTEINHLLDKIAFGGTEELRQIGLQQGLTALVNSLVDGVTTTAEDQVFDAEVNPWKARGFYYSDSNPGYGRIWTTSAAQTGQMYYSVFSRNPFREWMLLTLSAHFATNLNAINFSFSEWAHYGLARHWNLLRQYATGNFEQLTLAMYLDPAMNVWLDNIENQAGSPNQNYARELLELFTLGAVDPITGLSNYDEEGIVSTTAYVSGYNLTDGIDPDTGQNVIDIFYDSSRHDFGNYQVFRNIPAASFVGNMTPPQFLSHVLYNHPGAPRYIGERLAAKMLYPGLPEDVVAQLAVLLIQNNYELKPLLRTVLASSAMFSPQSHNACISSPIEHMVKLARRLLVNGLPSGDEETELRSYYFLHTLLNQAANAGQKLFEPPSVFGWKGECGITRNGTTARGEEWLTSQKLLNRVRGCGGVMDHLNWMDHDFVSSLGLTLQMNSEEIITQVAHKVYNTTISEDQMQILVTFLENAPNGSGGVQRIDVDIFEEYFVRRKITRLICLLGTIVESILA